MKDYEIRFLLMNALPLQEVYISNNGSGHFQVIAVGEIFSGMNCLKKQQIVYAPLIEHIRDNRIHALSIRAYTPQEWNEIEKNNL